jgi:hypothetical protein
VFINPPTAINFVEPIYIDLRLHYSKYNVHQNNNAYIPDTYKNVVETDIMVPISIVLMIYTFFNTFDKSIC